MKAQALLASEFATLLRNVLSKSLKTSKTQDTTSCSTTHIPSKMGLAVSGGIDSMALAFLSRQLITQQEEFAKCKFHAMIVDHGIRNESAQEALDVRNIMNEFGFDTTLIKLDLKPQALVSKEAENGKVKKDPFETEARQKRYQAFARTCLENGIQHILTGHHNDDQAETVLMRLIRGTGVAGLAGMKDVMKLSDCGDIYGADKLKLLRPFLGVEKNRLQATLVDNNIKWFEDSTNEDPTIAPRNAIRTLFSVTPSPLPKALHKEKLIALSERIAAKNVEVEENIDWFLQNCTLKHHLESASVELYIPQHLLVFPHEFYARVLKKLAEVVTPREKVDFGQMFMTTQKVFLTRLSETKKKDFRWHAEDPIGYNSQTFTSSQVLWESQHISRNINENKGIMIRFHRQPFKNSTMEAVPNSDSPIIQIEKPDPDKWYLWDNRFWLRYTGNDFPENGFIIRDTKTKAWDEVKLWEKAKGNIKNLKRTIGSKAPGKSKYTIPCVYTYEVGERVRWKAVCLPSMGYRNERQSGARGWEWKLAKRLTIDGNEV